MDIDKRAKLLLLYGIDFEQETDPIATIETVRKKVQELRKNNRYYKKERKINT